MARSTRQKLLLPVTYIPFTLRVAGINIAKNAKKHLENIKKTFQRNKV